MRAMVVERFGEPEVLQLAERPDLSPQGGEVVIRVEAADTLWLETGVRRGTGQDYWPQRPPYVPGNGVAGVVERAGADVAETWLGCRVVAHTGNEGGYADQAVAPVDALSVIPDDVSSTTAAALLHDAPTALRIFDNLQVGAEDTVLVVGASGGLGLLCVQLARTRAAGVVALARDETKIARIADLGVEVVDTESPDWIEQARAAVGEEGADVVIDNIGGSLGVASFELLAFGGRFSGHGTPSGSFASLDEALVAQRGVTVTGIEAVQMSPDLLVEYTDQALSAAAAAEISPVIGQTFPLERASEAHRAIEARTVFGKTLLTT